MKWEAWFLICYLALQVFICIWRIEHPQPRRTASLAIAGVLEMAFIAYLVLRLAGVA